MQPDHVAMTQWVQLNKNPTHYVAFCYKKSLHMQTLARPNTTHFPRYSKHLAKLPVPFCNRLSFLRVNSWN